MSRYAVGDIHGCLKTLKSLLFDIIKIKKYDTIYFLGDYIDRGPRIKETIDFFLDYLSRGWDFRFLMGNHEYMMINENNMYDLWIEYHGKSTLDSFGIKHYNQLDLRYKQFFENLNYFFRLEKFILVHGSINTNSIFPMTNYEEMIWSRNYDIDITRIANRRLIVGHTPTPINNITNSIKSNVIFLDGGCVYKEKFMMGNLCGLNIDTLELYHQKNID